MFQAVGSLIHDREGAFAAPLPNGLVLIPGGEHCATVTIPTGNGCSSSFTGFECTTLNTAELYNESTGMFTLAGSGSSNAMTTTRGGPAAVVIKGSGTSLDGQVLIVGGTAGSSFVADQAAQPPAGCGPSGQTAVNTAELYNPATDTFTALANTVPVPSTCGSGKTSQCGITDPVALPLQNGNVLIAGGDLTGFLGTSTNLAFVFNPSTETFTPTTAMNVARELPASTVLPDGRVLAAGGVTAASAGCPSGDVAVTTNNTAEVYDPTHATWTMTGNTMSTKRIGIAALPFISGPLAGLDIIAGGADPETASFPACKALTALTEATTASADLFDETAMGGLGAFTPTGAMNLARDAQGSIPLGSGSNEGFVIVAGGSCTNNETLGLSSWIVGTTSAGTSCKTTGQAANAGLNDYGELYNPMTQTWTVLTGTGSGPAVTPPANAAAFNILP